PDGSLPAEGWTSIYNPQRNEPFENTIDLGRKLTGDRSTGEEWYAVRFPNYLPFPELFYPYMAFDRDGNLCISRGLHYRSSGLKSLAEFARFWEIPRVQDRQLPDTLAVWWKMRLRDGLKIDNVKGHGFDGKEQPPLPSTAPVKKDRPMFAGECGLAF